MKRSLSAALYLLSAVQLNATCKDTQPWQRVSIKHKEFNGIGYDSGYTSLDLFFATSPYERQLCFLDARAHVLNTGSFALNAGIGTRYLLPTSFPTILGINTYYDYRTNKGLSFNQIGIGLEALGTQWEARVNGYIPIGGWNQYQGFEQSGFAYSALHFYQHYLVIGQTGNQVYTSPVGEIDSEFGYHFQPTRHKDLDLYLGAGPYYLQWSDNRIAVGGATRLALSMSPYISFTATYSYDRFFRNIGQGEFSFTLPFGKEELLRGIETQADCDLAYFLNKRISQDVYRQEILPIKSVYEPNANGIQYAINPLTNLPYYFVFVNNTSHSEGTYESPYPTLLEAQNNSHPYNIIYVYPGDGTTTGLNSGFTLQYNQWMFGAAIPHTIPVLNIGPVTIPPMATTAPIITNTHSGLNAITLGNQNIVAGFTVLALNGDGIIGTGVSNPILDQNTFIGTTTLNTTGIYITDPTGKVQITNSLFDTFYQIQNANGGSGAVVELDTTAASIELSNNTFTRINSATSGFVGGAGFLAFINGGNLTSFAANNNNFTDIGLLNIGQTTAFGVSVESGSVDSVVVTNSTFNNFGNTNGTGDVLTMLALDGTINNVLVQSCNFSNITGGANGVAFYSLSSAPTSGGIRAGLVENCTFSNLSDSASGVTIQNEGGNMGTLTITNCLFESLNSSRGVLSIISLDNIDRLIVTNNGFTNLSGSSVGVHHISSGGTMQLVEVESNIFTNLPNCTGIIFQISSGSTFDQGSATSNSFSNLSGTAVGINYNSSSTGFTAVDISQNNWSGTANTNPGWGVSATVDAGTTCMALENNTANPATTVPHSILLTRNGGTLNVEAVSTNLTKSGAEALNQGASIDTSGTINYVPQGTCP